MKNNKVNLKLLAVGALIPSIITPLTLASCGTQNSIVSLTFDAGEGTFTSATPTVVTYDANEKISKTEVNDKTGECKLVSAVRSFSDIVKPTVESTDSSRVFAGWTTVNPAIDKNAPLNVSDNTTFSKNTKIYAKFTSSNAATLTKHLEFKVGYTGGSLIGNVNLYVNKGMPFFTVNKPVAVKSGTSFQFWTTKENDATTRVRDLQAINDNMVLYPYFVKTIAITFNKGTDFNLQGPTTVSVLEKTKFSQVGRPNVILTNASKAFSAWALEGSTDPLADDYEFTDDASLDAVLVDHSGDQINVTFAVGDAWKEAGIIISGSATVTVAKDTLFKNMMHAMFLSDAYHFKKFVYKNGDEVKDDDKMSEDTTIYATFEQIGTVTISTASTTIYKNSNSNVVYAYLYPTSLQTSATCKWEIDGWSGAADQIPSISRTGDTKQQTIYITTKNATGTFNLKCTATLDSGSDIVSTPLAFTVTDPYIGTSDFTCYDETNKIWYALDATSLCDETGNAAIIGYNMSTGEEKSFVRSEFNLPVYIGSAVTAIPDYFLTGCSALTYAPIFGVKDATSKSAVTRIGKDFMMGCTALTTSAPNFDAASILDVGDNFMAGCTNFNAPLSFTSIQTLGCTFLQGCESFNSAIDFGTALTTIDQWFMLGCKKFNTALTLPASLKSINQQFMYGCDGFSSTLTLNCGGDVFAAPSQLTLCSEDKSSVLATTGCQVIGIGATTFKAKFPDAPTGTPIVSGSDEVVYRHYA